MMAEERQKYYMDQARQQQEYHSQKAKGYKQSYQFLQVIIVVGALIVPVLLATSSIPQIVPVVVSILVAIATGLENVFKNGEKWVSFRRTSELIKREQRMYFARAAEYATSNPFDVFVQRVEVVLSEQNQTFVQSSVKDQMSPARASGASVPPGE
ncbi:MAG: DUF4231 domain-containing protein [Anaerolineae bacterium]|nr:DUF4231 domain-containing protein [Anaerolineae bacterium]MCA9909554.1 DUF4231 domain-containing protein [Anaerolineae bacterium]